MSTNLKHNRRAIGVLLFICSSLAAISQSHASLDTIFYLHDIPITESHINMNLHTKIIGDDLTFSFVHKDSFVLSRYNLKTNKITRSCFKLDGQVVNSRDINDVAINAEKDMLYLLLFKKVLVLSLAKQKSIASFDVGHAEYIFCDDEGVITGHYYNFHPADSKSKCGLQRFTFSGQKVDSISFEIPFPEYTHYQPKRLIAYRNNTFAIPLFNGMNVLLIDSKFKSIDTLSFNVGDWMLPSVSLSEMVAKNPDNLSLYFGLLDKSNYKKISRIEHVSFLDNDKLLLRWYRYDSVLNYSIRNISILIKNGFTWSVDTSYVETPFPFDTSLPIFSGGMPLMSNNYRTEYTNNNVYQFKVDIAMSLNKNMSYKEFYVKKKELERASEPQINLWIFNIE